MSKNIIITGGHHSSSIPLILKLQQEGYTVIFVGHKYASVLNKYESSEYKEITSLGIEYVNLTSPKFYNVKGYTKYFKLLTSLFRSLKIICKYRPILVISYGGYLAVPMVIGAKIFNTKVVTHGQTLTVGIANKLIQKVSTVVFVSWDENARSSKKYVYVGLPLRKEILNVHIKKSKSLKVLFVQGGKQGSHVLNQFIFDNINKLTQDFVIYHQTSKHSINNDHLYAQQLREKYRGRYFSFDFLFGKDYSSVLEKSDFILSRSGAHIVYEMSYLKMPAIFIPIPWASQNEQFVNAQNANSYTPCVILVEKDLSVEQFYKSLAKLKSILNKRNSYKEVKTDSTEVMCKQILKVIKSNV